MYTIPETYFAWAGAADYIVVNLHCKLNFSLLASECSEFLFERIDDDET
jgi:hypothetical protein